LFAADPISSFNFLYLYSLTFLVAQSRFDILGLLPDAADMATATRRARSKGDINVTTV
jgi:hypothetical protein